jgi:site-specific recombinase XerD
MTLGIAEVIVLRTTESERIWNVCKNCCQWLRRFIQKIRPISIKDVNLGRFIYVSSKDYNIYLSTIQNDGAAFINPSCK